MALCFATNNRHKLNEVRSLLPEGYPLLSLQDIGCDVDLPETRDTLEGNARQKAAYVAEHFQVDCFADDTGLEVEALDGAPGVYSARYAGPERNDQANCSKLLQELKGKNTRNARFRTAICLVRGAEVHSFEGIVSGTIIDEPRGALGFGYDPVFMPVEEIRTFAEMSTKEKNHLSHRGKAIRQLTDFLQAEF